MKTRKRRKDRTKERPSPRFFEAENSSQTMNTRYNQTAYDDDLEVVNIETEHDPRPEATISNITNTRALRKAQVTSGLRAKSEIPDRRPAPFIEVCGLSKPSDCEDDKLVY